VLAFPENPCGFRTKSITPHVCAAVGNNNEFTTTIRPASTPFLFIRSQEKNVTTKKTGNW
jgi:hypothetical protein